MVEISYLQLGLFILMGVTLGVMGSAFVVILRAQRRISQIHREMGARR